MSEETAPVPYRPSNGCEGMDFADCWCARCIRDADFSDGAGEGCPILAASLAFRADEAEYPPEWIEDDMLGPRCTAFEPVADEGEIPDARQAVLAYVR